jgi:hypothetical protein
MSEPASRGHKINSNYFNNLAPVHCEFHPLNPDFSPFIVLPVPYPQ